MCFHTQSKKTGKQLERRFDAYFLSSEWYTPGVKKNGSGEVNWCCRTTCCKPSAIIDLSGVNNCFPEFYNLSGHRSGRPLPFATGHWLPPGRRWAPCPARNGPCSPACFPRPGAAPPGPFPHGLPQDRKSVV